MFIFLYLTYLVSPIILISLLSLLVLVFNIKDNQYFEEESTDNFECGYQASTYFYPRLTASALVSALFMILFELEFLVFSWKLLYEGYWIYQFLEITEFTFQFYLFGVYILLTLLMDIKKTLIFYLK